MLGKPINLIDDTIKSYFEFRINRIIKHFNTKFDLRFASVRLDDTKKQFVLEFVKNTKSHLKLIVYDVNKFRWKYEWDVTSPGFIGSIRTNSYKEFPQAILKIL